MSEYIYLTSDSPIISLMLNHFYFVKNIDELTKKTFSFSNHFSNSNFQVESPATTLPSLKKLMTMKKGGPVYHPALNELFDYIHTQLNQECCEKVEVLFSLNGYTNVALTEKCHILLSDLSVLDLYFQHSRLVVIHKKTPL